MLISIEEYFKQDFPDEIFNNGIKTVQDLIDAVAEEVNG
ncbi:MAG: hypothetical protein WC082_13870 [Victivallales bacterium]